jgi:hypothetical protein
MLTGLSADIVTLTEENAGLRRWGAAAGTEATAALREDLSDEVQRGACLC